MATGSSSGEVAILLVDDRDEDLSAMATILGADDYKLVAARSAAEALRRILSQEFALILLDVMMPIMDGFELATLIRQRDRSRHTPIIFLTSATDDMRFIYRAYSVGAVDYLPKPIDRDVVRAKVSVFVELFRKDQRIREQAAELLDADRKARELEVERLRLESERRYRNLAEAIPEIVWTATPDGSLSYANHRWCEYAGLGLDELRGWRWLELVHVDDATRFEAEWRRAVASGNLHEGELRLRRADGTYRWHLCRAVPERGTDGDVVGWLGTFSDCDDLKHAIQARDEFLLIASHELRTPLTALRLQLESLQRSLRDAVLGGATERARSKVALAVRQTDRLHRLVESLLDVSRVAAGKLRLEVEEFDLAALARDTVERLGDEARAAGCRIELETEPIVGRWDRLRMEQVLTNLLANAVKYAPGGPIEVAIRSEGEAARLTVRDHGGGISPDHLPRLFQRFQRAGATRHYGGLGMGLYIARQIVEAHGGVITVVSEPRRGATFSVEIPLAAPRRQSERPAGSSGEHVAVPRLLGVTAGGSGPMTRRASRPR